MPSFSGAFFFCHDLICPCFHLRKDSNEAPVLNRVNSSGSTYFDERGSVPGSPLRAPQSYHFSPHPNVPEPLNFSLHQIIKLTHNFSPSFRTGEGVFGTVYKGELANGQLIAIKRAKKVHFATLKIEFSNEVALLAKIEHRCLVRLLGYVDEVNERIIITEYVPNGTLREHLDGKHGNILDFSQRLEIAIDVAHGLTYLHSYAEKPIIHRDINSKNILLTERFRAKVADFGFARIGPTEPGHSHVDTKVRGTAGYVDPEYLKTSKLTLKSDVFAFGILLIEILSGRRPVDLQRTIDERITVKWVYREYIKGNVQQIMDPMLQEEVDLEVLNKIFDLAFQCAAPVRRDRPAMKEVAEKLWAIRKDYVKSRSRA